MQVKDVMVPVAGHISADMTLRDAAERMKALNIDPMPVVEGGHVVGVLTEHALQQQAARDGLATGTHTVEEAMSREVICCQADQTIKDAIHQIEEHVGMDASGRIPVTDRAGRLVGIVSVADLRRRQANEESGETAADAVQSIEQLVTFDEDQVDYMSDASFPASDPLPPPSALARDDEAH